MTLPLLFFLPIVIVGLTVVLLGTFFFSSEEKAIRIGLVDFEQSKETEMITEFISKSSQFSEYIEVELMTEQKAKDSLSRNEISTYIIFPEQFISHLLQGNGVTISVVGNPEKALESLLVKELMDSVTKHIRSSQANILTINEYAKDLGMNQTERDKLMMEQFQSYILYTLGSNKVIKEIEVNHSASSHTVHYFGTSLFFILTSIWLLLFYNILHSDQHKQMKKRMNLYGVTEIQQIIARIFISFCGASIFSFILFIVIQTVLEFNLTYKENLKLVILVTLYSGTFLFILATLEVLITVDSIRLFIHCFLTLSGILLSGSIIPTIYFPLWIQEILPYLYFYEAFQWMIEIIVHNRVYTNFLPLLSMILIAYVCFLGISKWKERVK